MTVSAPSSRPKLSGSSISSIGSRISSSSPSSKPILTPMHKPNPTPTSTSIPRLSPKLRHKPLTSIFIISLLILVSSVLFFNYIGQQPAATISKNCSLRLNFNRDLKSLNLKSPNGCLKLEKVTTEAGRIQGLSDRLSMPQNRGMLFVFDESGQQCMWMKDMHFGLDMLWLNENKEIVKIAENATPDTYPNSFCSEIPAKYVLELNSGLAQKSGLKLGQKLYL